jgi:CheY-like chemotaxis protein
MDPSQIDQILANLCVNARDAISDTGNIIIKTAAKVLDAKQCLKHADFIPGEYAVLTVSDDGCGMDEDTLKNIFEPFFTTKPIDKGTGLGLATVYGIVRQNNGFIAVRSEPGKGTEFEIYLPQYKETPPSTGKQRCKAIQHHGHERILLVEDNKALLEMISTMLSRSGYEVIPANSPHEAIALAHNTKTTIDLLVTDVIMPEMNGRTLFGNIEKMHPETRCLFMSGYTADVISQHGVLDEGVHFLEKPFVTKDLMAKINEVMRRERDSDKDVLAEP